MKTNPPTYRSHADFWEDSATIRTRPRRELEEEQLLYYPIERQPLCMHPRIDELGFEKLNYVLLQSLYKYFNDIIIFETEIVNKLARSIAIEQFPFNFPFHCRHDAMSVVIDEDYHAYVAMDYMHQVISQSGVEPIILPDEIELSVAIPSTINQLPEVYRAGMELIAVGISENTITADVASFSRNSSIKPSLKGLMNDHLADEGRHSIFWTNLVRMYWISIDEKARSAIGSMIPIFIDHYLSNNLQFEFDCQIVKSLNLSSHIENEIIKDIISSYPIGHKHPMIGNIISFLKLTNVLAHNPTRLCLKHFLREGEY